MWCSFVVQFCSQGSQNRLAGVCHPPLKYSAVVPCRQGYHGESFRGRSEPVKGATFCATPLPNACALHSRLNWIGERCRFHEQEAKIVSGGAPSRMAPHPEIGLSRCPLESAPLTYGSKPQCPQQVCGWRRAWQRKLTHAFVPSVLDARKQHFVTLYRSYAVPAPKAQASVQA